MDGGRGLDEVTEHEGSGAAPPGLKPLFLLTGLIALGYGGIFTLLADIRDQFGFSDADVGLIAFAGFASGFVSQVGLSRYADRGHTALMLRTGVGIAALSMLGMVVADELWAWIGARLLLGFGAGMVGPAIRRLVITRSPDDVGANLGTQTAFDLGGFVLGPIVAVVFAETLGLRAPFAVLAAVYGLALVMLLRLDLRTVGGDRQTAVRRAVRSLVKLPAVQGVLCTTVSFYLTVGMFEALWSILLIDLGAETWLVGVTLSVFSVPMIVLASTGGRLAQRKGPINVVTGGIFVASACTVVYGVGPLWLLVVASAVHALADAFTLPGNLVGMAVASPPEHVATGQGLLGATGLAVAGLSALSGAAVYEAFGRTAVFAGTAAVMVGFLLLGRWRWAAHAGHGDPVAGPAVPAP